MVYELMGERVVKVDDEEWMYSLERAAHDAIGIAVDMCCVLRP